MGENRSRARPRVGVLLRLERRCCFEGVRKRSRADIDISLEVSVVVFFGDVDGGMSEEEYLCINIYTFMFFFCCLRIEGSIGVLYMYKENIGTS